jgi:phospholipase C
VARHSDTATARPKGGIEKIQHVVMIMQENRSFDHYFGTYPGADGFPRDGSGRISVCIPNAQTHGCDAPYHDPTVANGGGPHGAVDSPADVDGGKMDGFVVQAQKAEHDCAVVTDPSCRNSVKTDVMGYHDAREIPNYWSYAQHFVLQDHMFEPNASWSLPAHLFLVSEWSARCTQPGDAMS